MNIQKRWNRVINVYIILASIGVVIGLLCLSWYGSEWWVQKLAHTQEIELRLDKLEGK